MATSVLPEKRPLRINFPPSYDLCLSSRFPHPHAPDVTALNAASQHITSIMTIQKITQWDDLEPYRARWDQLAGDCVFRSWDWLSTWWQHYRANQELFVLLVFSEGSLSANDLPNCQPSTNCLASATDEKELVAILPCYLETHFARGQVLRLLGDGEVCSDYLDLLAEPGSLQATAEALANYLCDHAHAWDTTDFKAIGVETPGLVELSHALDALDCQVTRTPNESCWVASLPDAWEAFLAMQSKSHRKQLRRAQRRVLESDETTWHLVETAEQLAVAWPILIDLHQRRRISLGEPGCFASQRWANFHHEVAQRLLGAGKLRLSWLEIAGQPVAAEYNFSGQQTTWSYQGGIDPDCVDTSPGQTLMIRTFQHAIQEGHQQFDLLRGDEPYKAHWRAKPQATFDIQIVPTRSAARLRWQALHCLQRAARLARQLTSLRLFC